MIKLEDASSELSRVLSGVVAQCQQIREDLSRFENHINTFFAGRLHLKLSIIRTWMTSRVEQLKQKYGDAGYICVFVSPAEGINPIWVENKQLVENKERYAKSGIIVFSVEGAFYLMTELDNNVNRGEWEKVTGFLEKYGRTTRLDWSKLPKV